MRKCDPSLWPQGWHQTLCNRKPKRGNCSGSSQENADRDSVPGGCCCSWAWAHAFAVVILIEKVKSWKTLTFNLQCIEGIHVPVVMGSPVLYLCAYLCVSLEQWHTAWLFLMWQLQDLHYSTETLDKGSLVLCSIMLLPPVILSCIWLNENGIYWLLLFSLMPVSLTSGGANSRASAFAALSCFWSHLLEN